MYDFKFYFLSKMNDFLYTINEYNTFYYNKYFRTYFYVIYFNYIYPLKYHNSNNTLLLKF